MNTTEPTPPTDITRRNRIVELCRLKYPRAETSGFQEGIDEDGCAYMKYWVWKNNRAITLSIWSRDCINENWTEKKK